MSEPTLAKRARLHTDVVEKNTSEPEMDRTAKRAKLQAGQADVTLLHRQLEAKTEECQHLNSKLNQIESDTRVQEQLSEACTLQSLTKISELCLFCQRVE